MRTKLIRSVVTATLFVVCAAVPAFAQSLVRGRVVDSAGKPVPDATITFDAQNVSMTRQAKTDGKGEFLIIGLNSGPYKMTATKEGVGSDIVNAPVTQGQNQPLTFTLRPAAPAGARVDASGSGDENKKAAAALQALAKQGADHLAAGRNDEAIAAYTQIVAQAPTCADCYFNLGVAHMNKKQYAEAEAAFKKVTEIKPDNAQAYTQLASLYNAQRKFDLAADASANAAKYSTATTPGVGGNAEALYNQGVVMFNGGKFADAKTAFEGATKADPKMAMAHYQLGMTALNLGDFGLAVSSLQTYLQLDPDGPKAAEVKASLPALEKMVKK
jgi:tetratricopeptide (TPR) repeat protein